MKDKSKRIQIPIYDVEIEVVLTSSVKDAIKDPKRVKRIGEYEDPGEGTLAVVLKEGAYFSMVFDRNSISHSLIAHEALHAVAGILHRAGIKIKDGNEPYAYLMGYVVNIVTNQLLKFGAKIK